MVALLTFQSLALVTRWADDMAHYTYILCDLITDNLITQLPFESVTFDRAINKAGNFRASFGLNRTGFDNQDVLDATQPGRTALYVDRDGQLVWGGIIWSRTWQEMGNSLQFTAQTFDSYFSQVDIDHTLAYTKTDQLVIVKSIIQDMQNTPSSNIGIQLPTSFPSSTINTSRDATFNWYEFWDYGKAITHMTDLDGGPDYTIDVFYDSAGNRIKYLNLANKLGTDFEYPFQYPGNITNYWYPENAAKGATRAVGIGTGEGSSIAHSRIDSNLIGWGYPKLTQFMTDKRLNKTDIASKTQAFLNANLVPVSIPTFQVEANLDPQFGEYQLGDTVRVFVESARFPSGLAFKSRIIGWSVTPAQSNSRETVTLTLDGADTSV